MMSLFLMFLMVLPNLASSLTEPTEVCSYSQKTYPSAEAALAKGEKILHCGACGKCSNIHDITIYAKTANTLTKTTTVCARKAVFWGMKKGDRCMKEKVGFTPECNACWIQNIECTRSNCLKTCSYFKVFGTRNPTPADSLDPCLECDEEKCGPAFMKCAGANRRRSGITSDISRPGIRIN